MRSLLSSSPSSGSLRLSGGGKIGRELIGLLSRHLLVLGSAFDCLLRCSWGFLLVWISPDQFIGLRPLVIWFSSGLIIQTMHPPFFEFGVWFRQTLHFDFPPLQCDLSLPISCMVLRMIVPLSLLVLAMHLLHLGDLFSPLCLFFSLVLVTRFLPFVFFLLFFFFATYFKASRFVFWILSCF